MKPQEVFEEAEILNKKYNFFITLNKKENLNGIPIAVKDNICTKGLRTTAGSKILEDYEPVFDATVIERLKSKSYSVLGKTAQDEFGFGTFSTNCAYNIPKNPIDQSRSCGGSSGGSAGYTKASKFDLFSIGQSTGGSISSPAAFCSIIGITPTYGLVSRYGLIDYANSLDKIGVFGKTVKTAAKGLSVIAGYDQKDSTSIKKQQENYESYCRKDVKKLKIAVIKSILTEGVENEVDKSFWNSIKKLESEGIKYQEISSKTAHYSLASYYIIAMAESSTNLAKYCGIRYSLHKKLEGNFDEYFSNIRTEGFGKEAKRRILLGTFVRMAGYRDALYLKALKIRSLIIQEFKSFFNKYDVILTPTMPIKPPRFDEIEKLTPAQIYVMDILTVLPNLCGFPMISVPVQKDTPIGLHLISDHLQESKIISVGDFYEQL